MKYLFLTLMVAISINTFGQTVLRGTIQDISTNQPISKARVSISDQGIGVVSSSNGKFLYKKYEEVLDRESVLTISASGYETIELPVDQIREMFNVPATFKLTPGTSNKEIVSEIVGVLWDVSENMKGRDTEKELNFLSEMLKRKGTVDVQFYVFNNEIVYQKKENIVNGDISSFRESLKSIKPSGSSNYKILNAKSIGEIFLFSNAQPNYGFLDIAGTTKVNVITSTNRSVNLQPVKDIVVYTDGSYYDLSQGTAAVNLDKFKKAPSNKISGIIMSSGRPLQTATVSVKGSFDEYYTDANGKFIIPAEAGEIIEARYLGMYPKSALVEDKNTINFELIPENEELDEVVLSGKKKSKDNTITTGYGKENKDKLGYSVSEITSDQFNSGATSLRDLITGQFSSVTVSYNAYEGESYRIRGGSGSINNDTGPLWVVDGTPYQQLPVFLDVQMIESISILKSLSATNRYGTLARGGAFIITTKLASVKGADRKEALNTALVKGNDYAEVDPGGVKNDEHPYMDGLRKKQSLADQYGYFKRMTEGRSVSLEFYGDAVQYFQKKDKAIANQVFDDFAYVARNNPKALRTLAYLYEEAGKLDEMVTTYKRILNIAPQEAQSYRDLANAYKSTGEYNKSLELYINMLGERIKGVDFSGIEQVLKTELFHLAKRHKDKIEFTRLPNEWLLPEYKQDIRMVIEWSDRSVPFEFQFVNPSNKYYKWKHTLEENRERLENEKSQGFQIEEFIIDEAPSGLWKVNVEYLGLEDDYVLPPFLKYTIYRDYGTKDERKEVKIIKLFRQSEKVMLGEILI